MANRMPDDHRELITKLLQEDPGQPVKDLARRLGVDRTFLADYLKALENQGYMRSKRIGLATVYLTRVHTIEISSIRRKC